MTEERKEKIKAYNKKYRQEHKAERNAYMKKFYEERPGLRTHYNKKWRENNPEKAKESNKRYYEKNKDKIKAYHKEWYKRRKIKMTLFEYIKNEATIEQIAQIFDNLENDSGYYSPSNVAALWAVLKDPVKYEKWTDYDMAYEWAIEELKKDIEEYIKEENEDELEGLLYKLKLDEEED